MPTQQPLAVVNNQPVEKVNHGDGRSLDVVEIYHTLQGEGPFVGWPAVFVRLAGCTLQCPMCDTNYTEGRGMLDVSSIIEAVKGIALPRTKLVVITGGEPFRQSIGPLVLELLHQHYKVQIETNGTVYDESMKNVWWNPSVTVVCSPKGRVEQKLKPYIGVLKYIVSVHSTDATGLPTRSLGLKTLPERPWFDFYGKVYVQPEDTKDPKTTTENIKFAVELCKTHGYILSLQLHKVCGIP